MRFLKESIPKVSLKSVPVVLVQKELKAGEVKPAHYTLLVNFHFIKLTLAVGTSCRKISIKLITLQERKPEAEKSRGDVTLLMAINTST